MVRGGGRRQERDADTGDPALVQDLFRWEKKMRGHVTVGGQIPHPGRNGVGDDSMKEKQGQKTLFRSNIDVVF